MKAGKRYADGDVALGLIQGVPLAFRTVAKRHYDDSMGKALQYHGGSLWPLLPLLWPDTKGPFPWQAGFEERFRAKQPLLCEPEGSQEREGASLLLDDGCSLEDPVAQQQV